MAGKGNHGKQTIIRQRVSEAVKAEMKKQAEPRLMDEINADYAKYCGELGQMKYNYQCLESQMNAHLQMIVKLKNEGMAREELDKNSSGQGDVKITAAD